MTAELLAGAMKFIVTALGALIWYATRQAETPLP